MPISAKQIKSTQIAQDCVSGGPLVGPNQGAVYWDIVSGGSELFFKNDSNVSTQLTDHGHVVQVGEINTLSSAGTGADGANLVNAKVGTDLRVKRVLAGTGILVEENANNIVITNTGGSGGGSGEANTASNTGTGKRVFKQKVGVDLQFRTLTAGTNVTLTENANDIVINATVSGGGSGETNTASNVGSGAGTLFKQKTGVNLEFKNITAGSGVTVTNGASDVTIAATGEANTASNSSSGTGTGTIFKAKVGTDLIFKKIIAGTNISIVNGVDDVTINASVSGGSGEANTASNVGTGDGQLFKQKSVADLQFRRLIAGTGIAISTGTNDVTITSTVSGGGSSISEYSASEISGDECFVRATGTGVTYSRSGTTGTFVVPGGVKILSFMIRTPASMASATFTIVHGQGVNTEALAMTPMIQVVNDGTSKTFRATSSYTITDPNYDRIQVSGLATTTAHRIRGTF